MSTRINMNTTQKLIYALMLLLLLLSGCANQTQKPQISLDNEDWSQHQAHILAIKDWQAIGKLGVKVPNDGGSASLRWQQQNTEYQIDLNGPMGLGKMIITGKPGSVSLLQGNNPQQDAKTAEELIIKSTGWNIPVTQLAYWVRGLPAAKAKVTHYTLNAQGLLGELEQMGWKVTYGDYLVIDNNNGSTITLPARITAEYQQVKLTLVIREWQLNRLEPPAV